MLQRARHTTAYSRVNPVRLTKFQIGGSFFMVRQILRNYKIDQVALAGQDALCTSDTCSLNHILSKNCTGRCRAHRLTTRLVQHLSGSFVVRFEMTETEKSDSRELRGTKKQKVLVCWTGTQCFFVHAGSPGASLPFPITSSTGKRRCRPPVQHRVYVRRPVFVHVMFSFQILS